MAKPIPSGRNAETFEEMLARYQREMMKYSKPQAEPLTAVPTALKDPAVLDMEESEAVLPAAEIAPTPEEDSGQIADEKYDRDTEFAYLRVEVQTADGALPVPDADVIVSRYVKGEPTLHQVFYTNESGETPTITLPAPPEALSEEPGNPKPYAEYVIRVDADGFLPMEFRDVPLFSGVTSVQTAQLQPEPENEEEEIPKVIFEGNSEVLDTPSETEGGA